jgi:hypothetical protein
MTFSWTKSINGSWLHLDAVNLQNVYAEGVYVIWYRGNLGRPGNVVYVGQGNIASRLSQHRQNPQIMRHNLHEKLLVSWLAIPAQYRDGAERYLADTWQPLEGSSWPEAKHNRLAAPWEAEATV